MAIILCFNFRPGSILCIFKNTAPDLDFNLARYDGAVTCLSVEPYNDELRDLVLHFSGYKFPEAVISWEPGMQSLGLSTSKSKRTCSRGTQHENDQGDNEEKAENRYRYSASVEHPSRHCHYCDSK